MTNTKAKTFPSGKELIKVGDLQVIAGRLNEGWRKLTESWLDFARQCALESQSMTAEERKMIITDLKFSGATFSKLIKIGSDKRLMQPEIAALLPDSYTIVYLVAQLSDEDLDAALAKGVINPEMKRSDLEKRRPRRESAQKALTHKIAAHDDMVTGQGVSPDHHESGDPMEALRAAWDGSTAVVQAWNAAPAAVRLRFVREVLHVEGAVPLDIAA